MKRNGFRENFIHLRSMPQVKAGIKLFLWGVFVFMIYAAFAAPAVASNFIFAEAPAVVKVTFDKSGLTGDELALIEKIEKRMNPLGDLTTADRVAKEVRAAMKEMLNDDGTPKFDVAKLTEMLGDTDKGIRSILKKQGDALKALQEGGGEKEKFNLRTMLVDKMEEIEKIFNRRIEGSEVRMNLRQPVNMTTQNTIDSNAVPDDILESFSLGAFVGKRFPREYIFDIASRRTVAEVEQYKTWLEEGNEEGAFAIVEEGAVKPLVSYDLVRNVSEVSKVAAKYVVTEEFAKFRKNAYSIIQRLINQKILRDYAAILTTSLLADAVPYTGSALDGQYDPANVTDYHAIAAVAAQIEALDFAPDVLIINPQDKWRIGMTQTADGHFYLSIPMTDPSGVTRLMGFIVRTSNRMPVGFFMLGESGLWEIEDEALTVRVGHGIDVTATTGPSNVTAVSSDFDNNRFRVIVETYFHAYIATPNIGSFVYAEFDAVKAAVSQ